MPPPRKPLTDDERSLMEQLDAMRRLGLWVNRMNLSADVQGIESCSTPGDIIKMINRLVRRDYITGTRYRGLQLTCKGLEMIARNQVLHLYSQDGKVRTDGSGNLCTADRPCWDCLRVKKQNIVKKGQAISTMGRLP